MTAGEIIDELNRLNRGGSYDPNKTSEAIAEAVEVIEDWKTIQFRQNLEKSINLFRGKGDVLNEKEG